MRINSAKPMQKKRRKGLKLAKNNKNTERIDELRRILRWTSPQQRWLELCQFARSQVADSTFASLDRMSLQLLEWILSRSPAEHPLFAQDLVRKSNVASPAVIHKSMKILVEQNFITSKPDEMDLRRRIIAPTRKTERELQRLNALTFAWTESLKT